MHLENKKIKSRKWHITPSRSQNPHNGTVVPSSGNPDNGIHMCILMFQNVK